MGKIYLKKAIRKKLRIMLLAIVLLGISSVTAQDIDNLNNGNFFPFCDLYDESYGFSDCCIRYADCALGCATPGQELANVCGVDPELAATCSDGQGYCLSPSISEPRGRSWEAASHSSLTSACSAGKSCYCPWGLDADGKCAPYTYTAPPYTPPPFVPPPSNLGTGRSEGGIFCLEEGKIITPQDTSPEHRIDCTVGDDARGFIADATAGTFYFNEFTIPSGVSLRVSSPSGTKLCSDCYGGSGVKFGGGSRAKGVTAGATVGAAAGTVVPGIGNVVGGIAGGIVGGITGIFGSGSGGGRGGNGGVGGDILSKGTLGGKGDKKGGGAGGLPGDGGGYLSIDAKTFNLVGTIDASGEDGGDGKKGFKEGSGWGDRGGGGGGGAGGAGGGHIKIRALIFDPRGGSFDVTGGHGGNGGEPGMDGDCDGDDDGGGGGGGGGGKGGIVDLTYAYRTSTAINLFKVGGGLKGIGGELADGSCPQTKADDGNPGPAGKYNLIQLNGDDGKEICDAIVKKQLGFTDEQRKWWNDDVSSVLKCCGDDDPDKQNDNDGQTNDCGLYPQTGTVNSNKKICGFVAPRESAEGRWEWIEPIDTSIKQDGNPTIPYQAQVYNLECPNNANFDLISYKTGGGTNWAACRDPNLPNPAGVDIFQFGNARAGVYGTSHILGNPRGLKIGDHSFACIQEQNTDAYQLVECVAKNAQGATRDSVVAPGFRVQIEKSAGSEDPSVSIPLANGVTTYYCAANGDFVQFPDESGDFCEREGGVWTVGNCCGENNREETYVGDAQMCLRGEVKSDCMFLDPDEKHLLFDTGSTTDKKIKQCGETTLPPDTQPDTEVVSNMCTPSFCADQGGYHCETVNGVTQWQSDRTLSHSSTYTPADGASSSACCLPNQCWDGIENQCVDTGSFKEDRVCRPNAATGVAEWVSGQGKPSLKADGFGFCPSESQCLYSLNVDQNGKVLDGYNKNFSRTLSFEPCVENGAFIQDNYCNHGGWKTRTAIVANQLLKEAADSQSYALFCDSYETAFNNVDYTVPGGRLETAVQNIRSGNNRFINNVCILSKGPDIFVGTSLNKEKDEGKTFLFPVKKDRNYCNNVDERATTFLKCNQGSLGTPPLGVAYNPSVESLYFANKDFTPSTAAGNPFEEQILQEMNDMLPDIKNVFSDSIDSDMLNTIAFQPKTFFFRKISDSKKITGILSGDPFYNQFVIIYSTPTPDVLRDTLCPHVQRIGFDNCNTVNGKTVIVAQGGQNVVAQGGQNPLNPMAYWPDLTSKLKLS